MRFVDVFPKSSPLCCLFLFFLCWNGAANTDTRAGLLELSLGKFKKVFLNKTIPTEAILRDIGSNVFFLIFQLHTHHLNTTVSFNKIPSKDSSVTGADVGLLSVLRPEQTVNTWYLQSTDGSALWASVVIIPYGERDPIPGGCNLEFNLETDPNIYLQYNLYETTIKFAPANLGYARGASPPLCDVNTDQNSRWRLQYDVYQHFLPESDFREAVLLSHLQNMSTVQLVKAYGIQLVRLTSDEMSTVSFSSIPGEGVIYNVIVRDPLLNTSAAYVPVHTYVCNFNATMDNCFTLGKISTKIFFTIIAVAGLFVCFFGHKFLKTVRLVLTAVTGAAGGFLFVVYWWRFGCVFLCMVIVGLVLGFLISSLVFFTPIGEFKVFHDDTVFWLTFTCIAMVVPLACFACPRFLNILACSIVGSYAVVLAINSYIYTSLSYITFNILKRALNTDFSSAYTNVPFQVNDIIIIIVWMILVASGLVVQTSREKGQPPFPPNPYKVWKHERARRQTNILDPSHHVPPFRTRLQNLLTQIQGFFQKKQPSGERTPLLL
ncbi:transmembrane 7 superfamily member 3 isoform X2 [Microcaecilia unicolor]|uniref:Transmembrane 7 superfamily member 3 isoform X2 n=1 Tax=Microcaecilia unicolor TaxID=1415580 RepID=A0A6P7Z3V1_9AMPH|nr:transmembrane 7 superfamily member 3 isoform X2 [Microcaecilia unicolor]